MRPVEEKFQNSCLNSLPCWGVNCRVYFAFLQQSVSNILQIVSILKTLWLHIFLFSFTWPKKVQQKAPSSLTVPFR